MNHCIINNDFHGFSTVAAFHALLGSNMAPSTLEIIITSIGLSISLFLYKTTVRVPKGLRLPPGPPRHPIWGNLKDFPSGETLEYRVYEKWAKEYGELVYLNVLGQSILMINSAEMERELFTKRGLIYSDRLKSVMAHDLSVLGKSTVVTMDYGERWTQHRAMLHDVISSKARLSSYHPVMEANARSLAQRLIAEPITDLKVVRHIVGSFIMEIVYGIDVLAKNDPYIKVAERFSEKLGQVLVPGTFYVDSIPILKYLPRWFPGVEFFKVAEELDRNFRDMLDRPYEYSKNAFNQGNYKPSFVSNCLEDLASNPNPPEDAEEVIRQIAVTIYAGGIDTLETQTRLFFLAMALYPDIQKKAQEELDQVVGRDNMPSFADFPKLPYLNALCNESLRWHPVAATHPPHKLKQDDEINGHFIPKGTICFGNTWSLLRSESEYGPDTDKFRPERFLDGSAKHKPDPAFGYGRRVCPGKALAESFFTIVVATVLHAATISVLKDEPLYNIVQNDEFDSGGIGRPRDFRCQISARPNAQNILQFMSQSQ